jgi:hypothetical protein
MPPSGIERSINKVTRFLLEKRRSDIAVETPGFEKIQDSPAPHAIILFGPHDKDYDSTLLMRAFGEITPDRAMYILGRAEAKRRMPNPLIVPVWAPVPGSDFRDKIRQNEQTYSDLAATMMNVDRSILCIAPNVARGDEISPREMRVGSLMGMVDCFADSGVSVTLPGAAAPPLAVFPLYMQTDRENEAHLYMGEDIFPQIAGLSDADSGLSRKSGPLKLIVAEAFTSLRQDLQQ